MFLSYFVWTQIKPDIVPALIFDTLIKKKCAELPQSCLYMQINAFAPFDTYCEKINSLIEKIKGDSVSTND